MTDLFLKILRMSVTAGWLVLAVALLRFLFPRMPKSIFPFLWGLVGLRLLIPVSLESSLSLIPSANDACIDAAQSVASGVTAASAVWCAGAAGMLLYGAASFLLLYCRLKTAVRLTGNIYQSEYVKSPFILGVFSPRIYLPFHLSAQDAANVVAHEQAHIKRRDHWRKPAAFILLSVYWFHPLIWAAYILLCRDIELACDEQVIREMDNTQRASYSQTLLSCTANRVPVATCPLAFGGKHVKKRIRSVLHYHKTAKWVTGAVALVLLVFGLCFMTDPKGAADNAPFPLAFQTEESLPDIMQREVGSTNIHNSRMEEDLLRQAVQELELLETEKRSAEK